MPKLCDLNIAGDRFCICDNCGTVYIKYAGYKAGAPCPKCGRPLLLKELTSVPRKLNPWIQMPQSDPCVCRGEPPSHRGFLGVPLRHP